MRTDVEIVATTQRSLRHRATGGLAVRQTGPTTAHLIGTAATPLGGDEIVVRVIVDAGARLTLGSVAAMLALPAAHRPDSSMRWEIEVGACARLRVDPQPTVVAGGAALYSDIVVRIDPQASVDLHEYVQIGRSATHRDTDAAGRWEGGLHIDAGDTPLLRHRLALVMPEVGARHDHRAAGSVFRYPDSRGDDVDAVSFAVRAALAGGGSLTTALGASAAITRRLCDDLEVRSVAAGAAIGR
ncbi:urease accessory protein UreD [Gordonia sp. ABSL1-1]|uniref:urease accessory protein UreD n=1 Tax=Gordonia sp. ABSL1-1 TaxID=3053923 RepID=UPI0025729730|nr:urease accessory protein UreD [Gordonia sp. ABSL1-1]MDL9937271.1 urease accessory protein UreD [Gordonia sp. ABSL1-1]